jgi:hypothetical protein
MECHHQNSAMLGKRRTAGPYAPLASVNDNPAAPKTGTALIRCSAFEACFARDM